jgi:Carboxypeptidase regulatory-like domain
VRKPSLFFVKASVCLFLTCLLFTAPLQTFGQSPTRGSQGNTGTATLEISLRLPDNLPFSGAAIVRILDQHEQEVAKTPSDSEGQVIFPKLAAGDYTVEVSAPGYETLREPIDWAAAHDRTLYLPMKVQAPAAATTAQQEAPPSEKRSASWPPDVDQEVPPVTPGVSCDLGRVLHGAGVRLQQFVSNLQKFSATEEVNHYKVDTSGSLRGQESKKFDYMVEVQNTKTGQFYINEYRDGSVDPTIFPAGIATEGVPAMALIFHPHFAGDYNFTCEGLGHWNGRPAWQVHFTQKPEHPGGIREYQVKGMIYPISLRGRAWIDSGTYQILRLETELLAPVEEIKLKREHIDITYGRVNFRTGHQEMWLPQTAEIYAEQFGHRYYRRHTFTDFHVFTVATAESYQQPKQSYCFTNTTDKPVSALLTVKPLSQIAQSVSVKFSIAAGASACKTVGIGKDLNLSPDEVASATLFHDGPPGALRPDAYLLKESTLDIVPNSDLKAQP